MRIISNLFPTLALLALSGICSSAAVVSNGGFETGSFSDWTLSGDSTYTNVKSVFPHSDSNAAHIGAYGDAGYGFISQMIATTPGAIYTLSFWYGEYNQNDPLADPFGYLLPANVNTTDPANPYFQANALTVLWNGGSIFGDANFFTSDQGIVKQGDGFWKFGTVSVQATGTSTSLSFGAFDQQQDVILDDINVSASEGRDLAAAPEPATLGLLGSALFGLGVLGRRRSRR